jgi:hypothetical protein
MGGMFGGLGSGETDEQSVFLRGEFSPVRGVENVGRVGLIAKGCYVVNDDVWRRDGTRKSSSLTHQSVSRNTFRLYDFGVVLTWRHEERRTHA